MGRLLLLLFLLALPNLQHAEAQPLQFSYLPAVSSPLPPPPKIGAAGIFHQEDCERFGFGVGQNWTTGRTYVPTCAEFVPNVSCIVRRYGDYTNGRLQLPEAVKNLPRHYSGYLLFLNEPLYTGQCSIDPHNAALLYWQTVELFPDACISSPNFSDLTVLKYSNEANAYIQEIADSAPNGRVFDGFCFWAVHNYHTSNPSIVYESLMGMMEQWGDGSKTIWVTEYGASKVAGVEPLMIATLCHPQITTAMWWGAVGEYPTALRDGDTITPVGREYLRVLTEYNGGLSCR